MVGQMPAGRNAVFFETVDEHFDGGQPETTPALTEKYDGDIPD